MCSYKRIFSSRWSGRSNCEENWRGVRNEKPSRPFFFTSEKEGNIVQNTIKIPQIIKRKFVMKMKQMLVGNGERVPSNCQKERILLFLETDVLFRVITVENSKKYMQTLQPFRANVGYNILGEGQLFIDETAGYAYNIKGLLILTVNRLLNRVNSECSIQEGEALCLL